MKCVVKDCEKDAQYLYFGKSLCKEHFQEQVKRTEESQGLGIPTILIFLVGIGIGMIVGGSVGVFQTFFKMWLPMLGCIIALGAIFFSVMREKINE